MKQQFVKEIRGHFNLRKPKGKKPTDVFFVVCLNGKQYKLSSGMKVYPDQWDSKMQLAIESNQLSRLDNSNNKMLNEKINCIRCSFVDFLQYLCTVEIETIDIEELLKLFIYKDMKKKKNFDFDAERVITDALEYYYANVSHVKERTKRNNDSKLNQFIAYIKEKGLNGDVTVFSQRGINDYRDYLLSKMNNGGDFGIAHLNGILELLSRLINKVLIVNTDYLQYHFSKVEYVKLPDNRTQEDICRFPLYDDEIQALVNCNTLTELEKEYRTVFLLQCECGLRVSDLQTLIRGKGEQDNGIIRILTEKGESKNLYAHVHITSKLTQYLFQDIPKFKLVNVNRFMENEYNKNLRTISEKAELKRIIDWKDSKGAKHRSKVYEVIVSHDARHTFITNEVKKGTPYDVLCQMTGHVDDKMIKKVYANLTKEDKSKKVRDYYNKQSETKEVIVPPKKVNVLDSVFGYAKLMQLKDLQENGAELRNLPHTKECIQIVLSTSNLTMAIEFSKDKDLTQLKEKALELYDIVESLTMLSLNPSIYHIFEYKLFKFGFIKEMMPTDMIEEMFREPTEEEIAQAQLEEHIEWLNRK